MRYSRPARIILGILILVLFFLYERNWFQNCVYFTGNGQETVSAAPAETAQAQEPQSEAEPEAEAVVEVPATPEPTLRPESSRRFQGIVTASSSPSAGSQPPGSAEHSKVPFSDATRMPPAE